MENVLIIASVASMIDQFNMANIKILLDMGHHVDVACNFECGSSCTTERITELKKKLESLSVDCIQIDFERNVLDIRGNVRAFIQIRSLIKQRNYGIVHCHAPICAAVTRLAFCRERKHGTRIIYTAHGFHFFYGAPLKNWLLFYPVEKVCARMTDVLITINLEDYELAKKKLHAKKVVYSPGIGVDIGKFKKIQENDILTLRKEIGILSNQIWLLSVGELNRNKNHESVMRAMKEIPNLYYTIAGQGELDSYLMELAKKLEIQDRFKLLGFRNDISRFYQAADVFIFPSMREGLSVALMEAMASGKMVVCSRIRGNTDLVDEHGGILFTAGNVSEIESSLRMLNEMTEEQRTRLGEYNAEKIKQFDRIEVDKIMRDIYETV